MDITGKQVRIVVKPDPPQVLLGYEGEEMDITEPLLTLGIELGEAGCNVIVAFKGEIPEFDFPVTTVSVLDPDAVTVEGLPEAPHEPEGWGKQA